MTETHHSTSKTEEPQAEAVRCPVVTEDRYSGPVPTEPPDLCGAVTVPGSDPPRCVEHNGACREEVIINAIPIINKHCGAAVVHGTCARGHPQ